MQRNNFLKGLAGIVSGAALSFSGCSNDFNKHSHVNHAPTITISEVDGTIVNPTNDLFEEVEGCDKVYNITASRGNILDGQLDFNIIANDVDENDVLRSNTFPVNNDAFSVNVISGENTDNNQEFSIEINPSRNVALGTYEIVRATTTDGTYSTTSCVYLSVAEGTIPGPGGIPQIPEVDDNNQPPIQQPSLLERVVTWACDNLDAANGTNIRVYAVTPVNNYTSFTSREIAELIPGRNPQADTIYELVRSGPTNNFYVAVEGNTPSGQTVAETIRGMNGYDDSRNPNARISSNAVGGYTPDNCSDLYVINSNPQNPTPQPIPNGVFTVLSTGE